MGFLVLTNGVYYYVGDLQIDSGVTLFTTKNIQLRVRGHLQINGTIDSSESGHSGADALVFSPDHYSVQRDTRAGWTANENKHNLGTARYLGPSISDGGGWSNTNKKWNSHFRGWSTPGAVASVPVLNLEYQNGTLVGLPQDLQGASGPTGHASWPADYGTQHDVPGGAGGTSGGGIAIIARGVSFGASGGMNTSGGAGSVGKKSDIRWSIWSGTGGGGMPGAVVFVIDGLNSQVPSLSKLTALVGEQPFPSGIKGHGQLGQYPGYTAYAGNGGRDMSGFGGGAARIVQLGEAYTPVEDDPESDDPPSWNDIEDKPKSLYDISPDESAKLKGIADGATVGADWDDNLSNRPKDGDILNPAVPRGTNLIPNAQFLNGIGS